MGLELRERTVNGGERGRKGQKRRCRDRKTATVTDNGRKIRERRKGGREGRGSGGEGGRKGGEGWKKGREEGVKKKLEKLGTFT